MNIAERMVKAFGNHPTRVQIDAIKKQGSYVDDVRARGGVAYEFKDGSWVRITWNPIRALMCAYK